MIGVGMSAGAVRAQNRPDRTCRMAAREYVASLPASAAPGILGLPEQPVKLLIFARAVPAPQAAAIARAAARLRACAQGAIPAGRAWAQLILGIGEARLGETLQAGQDLQAAARTPEWSDLAIFLNARQAWLANQPMRTAQLLQSFGRQFPRSPLRAPATRLALSAAVAIHNWPRVTELAARLEPSPRIEFWQARAEEHQGNPIAAARYNAAIYFDAPLAAEAGKAGLRLERIQSLEAKVITRENAFWMRPPWTRFWTRGQKLLAGGRIQAAIAALQRAYDLAPVHMQTHVAMTQAWAWRRAGDRALIAEVMPRLLASPQRAEALNLEFQLALDRQELPRAQAELDALRRLEPHGVWYARALVSWGDDGLNHQRLVQAQAAFDAYTRALPRSSFAPSASWRAAWLGEALQEKSAGERLRRYLWLYPRAGNVPDALYWLGRRAEKYKKWQYAAACFRADATRYPQTWFGHLAAIHAGRLSRWPAQPVPRLLYHLPPPAHTPARAPMPAGLEFDAARARWLAEAGLPRMAVWLLRPASWRDPRNLSLAETTAEWEAQAGDFAAAYRTMAAAVPDYLQLDLGQLPRRDWRLLYPFPRTYRSFLAAQAQRYGLPVQMVLGLIRQESGFNPGSLSYTYARGLMQLEYPTARRVARALGVRLESPEQLYQPEMNLRLGLRQLYYLRQRFQGHWEQMLAAYNAGSAAVSRWLDGDAPDSPAGFIESIPYIETRHYVAAVMRNAWMYRRLYQQ